ncbi:uncharacterized protein J3D65DRAFT_599811 [Phyllosticta citribraziliensis]|uniref:Uncharacterized protein n=1 Tax=Phyllosticta citribraziliensis TaxID=989973 RepID=A0ABR1M4Q1_9PEZI
MPRNIAEVSAIKCPFNQSKLTTKNAPGTGPDMNHMANIPQLPFDLMKVIEHVRVLLIDLEATLNLSQKTISDLIETCSKADVNLSGLPNTSMEGTEHGDTEATPPIDALLAQHLRDGDEKAASDRLATVVAQKTLKSTQILNQPLERSLSHIRATIPTLVITTNLLSAPTSAKRGIECLHRLKQEMLPITQHQRNVLEPFLAQMNQILDDNEKLCWDLLADDERARVAEISLYKIITAYGFLDHHNFLEEAVEKLCAYHLRPNVKKLQMVNDQLSKYRTRLENWREHIPLRVPNGDSE